MSQTTVNQHTQHVKKIALTKRFLILRFYVEIWYNNPPIDTSKSSPATPARTQNKQVQSLQIEWITLSELSLQHQLGSKHYQIYLSVHFSISPVINNEELKIPAN